jgi:hypothetical protein
MKKLFLFILMTISSYFAMAQDSINVRKQKKEEKKQRINAIAKQEEEGVIVYKKHIAGGIKLTNDGAGVFGEIARARSVEKALLFQIEITERKHTKEEKLQNDYSPTAPVIYGKINYFYPVKLGVQISKLVGNKGNKNGVSLTFNYGGGISLGLLRPYLVEVDKGNGNYEFVGYNSPDSSYFLNGPIVGGPTLSEGWSKMKITPGIYAKTGLRFDYGKYNEMINGLEIGATAEFYSKKIPQMIVVKQYQYFLGAYVTLVFGRRK